MSWRRIVLLFVTVIGIGAILGFLIGLSAGRRAAPRGKIEPQQTNDKL